MSILILYGSETGTAQDISETLRRESEMRHLPARVYGLDEFDINQIKSEKLVIFVVSTTGQGEIPPNMRGAWRFLLKKSLGNDFLQNVKIAVLGLGDSSYQKYNFAAKKIYRRLLQLGAQQIVDLALADDQHEIGIDGAYIPWKTALFEEIYNSASYEKMTKEIDIQVGLKPKYRFKNVEEFQISKNENHFELQDYNCLKVQFNNRITADNHFQETRHVRFNIPTNMKHIFSYKAGDVLMIRPHNPDESVRIAIEALGFDENELDRKVKIEKNCEFSKEPMNYLVGKPTTIRKCLKKYFDLQQIPKRSFFEVLSLITENETEKEKLIELSSSEGLDDLLDYSTRCRRTVAETLRDFPATSKNIKADQLFELLTVIRPRAFSIASRPNSDYIDVLVAKVEYKSRMAEKRRGLCSTYISRLNEGDEVFCKVRSGTFKFPPDSENQNLICVGPGTGVAPFRSLFGYYEDLSIEKKGLLFFGCRNEKSDFYFEKEWKNTKSVEVITAFSRDGKEKVYVQHKIRENAEKVWKVLENDGYVFVAGSAGDMPKAVTEAIDDVAKRIGRVDKWSEKAESKGRIQFETWS